MKSHNSASIVNATKWSAIGQIISKLANPITTMVLARLLTPEAFGVVATLTMIISFTEIFTDAGFQRYIIQHEFKNDEDKYRCINVAFWSNLTMSIVLWILIIIFSDPLARLVGNPGLGNAISIACISIPIAAFSSIQTAIYKRDLDFKTLINVNIIGIVVPLTVTIPLAFWLRNYWALIIGAIVVNSTIAIVLTIKSKWKPSFYFNFKYLKEMFNFCSWTIVDTVLVWITNYIDIFCIGLFLNEYYLGIYKTSISIVGHITALVTTAILPIILPAISRQQDDYDKMRETILKFQKHTAILLLPLGVGIFVFSDFITNILLGSQWHEASGFIGLWGIMEVVTVVFARFCSCIYIAIGKPKISVIAQFLHLIVLVPVVLIAAGYGYEILYYARSFVRLEGVAVNMIFAYFTIRLSSLLMFKNIIPEIFACCIMGLAGYQMLSISDNIFFTIANIILCIVIYYLTLMAMPNERKVLGKVLQLIKRR